MSQYRVSMLYLTQFWVSLDEVVIHIHIMSLPRRWPLKQWKGDILSCLFYLVKIKCYKKGAWKLNSTSSSLFSVIMSGTVQSLGCWNKNHRLFPHPYTPKQNILQHATLYLVYLFVCICLSHLVPTVCPYASIAVFIHQYISTAVISMRSVTV